MIKVYPSSLALVPWSLNSKLEQFYRDPNLFRLAHRGDIKTFEVRIAANRDVKPYKGRVEEQIIVDPIMIGKFLDQLDLDNNPTLEHTLNGAQEFPSNDNNQNSDDDSLSSLSSKVPSLASSSEDSDSDGPDDGNNPLPVINNGGSSNETFDDPSLPSTNLSASNSSVSQNSSDISSTDNIHSFGSGISLKSEQSMFDTEGIYDPHREREIFQYSSARRHLDSVDNHLRSTERLLKLIACLLYTSPSPRD